MLTENLDGLLDAAIASTASNKAENGVIYNTDGSYLATITVYNPGVTATLMDDTGADLMLARSVATGYTCTNGGCHINGNFNSMTAKATFGSWWGQVIKVSNNDPNAPTYVNSDGDTCFVPGASYLPPYTFVETATAGETFDLWDLLDMRDGAIKGHTLKAVDDMSLRNVAFANVGRCNFCHDTIDYRISNTTKQFPHGNDVILPDGSSPQVEGMDHGVPTGEFANDTNAAWFTLKPNTGGTAIITNERFPDGSANSTYTVGMDGACLKCHRSTSDAAGVGIDY